jgi:hypothetical protein
VARAPRCNGSASGSEGEQHIDKVVSSGGATSEGDYTRAPNGDEKVAVIAVRKATSAELAAAGFKRPREAPPADWLFRVTYSYEPQERLARVVRETESDDGEPAQISLAYDEQGRIRAVDDEGLHVVTRFSRDNHGKLKQMSVQLLKDHLTVDLPFEEDGVNVVFQKPGEVSYDGIMVEMMVMRLVKRIRHTLYAADPLALRDLFVYY